MYKVVKNLLPSKISSLLINALAKVEESKPNNPLPVNTLLYFAQDLSPYLDIDKLFDEFAVLFEKEILSFTGVNRAYLLKNFHAIRKVQNQNRHITGIHYDFQTSNAYHNSTQHHGVRGVTIWMPLKDIRKSDAGLIIFDKDLLLKDIHEAAGHFGYISNIPFIDASPDNKRFTIEKKYKRYIRNEPPPHIVDILHDFKIDDEMMPQFKALHKQCMENIYQKLRGRYYITEMELGDVLFFDSECYHGTYLPDCEFKPRFNLDIRAVVDFEMNDETDIFETIAIPV